MTEYRALRGYVRPLAVAASLALVTGAMGLSGLGGTASAAASAGCGRAAGLASGTHTIQSGGKNRSYILKVPDSYDSNYPHRLAFGYHWLGGTAEQVAGGGTDGAAWAYYGMQSQSGNSTIFVAPQGLNNGWGNSGGEDVTLTDDMIKQIENGLCVDTTQLFSVGFSYGGAMSAALACARPTVFRAVVAIAAPGSISGCSGGTGQIAYMGIHGVSDSGIAGGRTLRDRFVANNGCTRQNPPEPAAGSRTHILTAYSGCRAGYPVVWAAFDGGHQQGPVDGCAGCESGARSWVKPEVWKFFSQFGSGPTTTTTTTTTTTSSAATTTTTTLVTTTGSPLTTTSTTTTGGGTGGCTATATQVDQWPGGFVAHITVTAGSASISGWKASINLPSGAAYSNGWNATFSGTSGTIQATNVNYNGSLAAGQSTTFGFQGTGTASGLSLSCAQQ